MKLTIYRLIFKCQPEQKMIDAKMLMAYWSASLLQNRLLPAVLSIMSKIKNSKIEWQLVEQDVSEKLPHWLKNTNLSELRTEQCLILILRISP